MKKKLNLVYFKKLDFQRQSINELKENFNLIELNNPDELTINEKKKIDILFAPLGHYFGTKFFNNCPNLKIIASNTTGHPHIDVKSANSRNIKVITLKNDNIFLDQITPTAEHTIGLMISIIRRYNEAFNAPLNYQWNRKILGGMKMISRLKIGIIGYGRIGRKVSDICLAMGSSVQFYDPYVSDHQPLIKKIKSLKNLVKTSDVISVHVPHEKNTENLLSDKILLNFKPGSFLINTARGELIDENSLIKNLKNGKISGAAIDVLSNEFDPNFYKNIKKNKLIAYAKKNPNLIITPHVGGSTYDAWKETEMRTIKKIKLFVGKKNYLNPKIKRKDIIAFIPARGGSKSIKLKNMAKLDNKPLVSYPIKLALKLKRIKTVVCSSDNEVILKTAKNLGANIDKRPKWLAKDNTSTVDVIIEYLNRYERKFNILPEYLLLLEPTSPFIREKDITSLINKLDKNPTATSAQTVTEVDSNSHAFNQRYHDKNGSHFFLEKFRIGRFNKQLKPKFYIHGNARLSRVKNLIEEKSIFGTKSLPVVIDRISAFDIDNSYDFAIAENLIKSDFYKDKSK